jgi:hypothetical protein
MGTQRYLGLQGHKLQLAIGIIAGMDFLLFGYDQGVTGGLLTLESFIKYFPTIALNGPHFESLSSSERSAQSTRQGGYQFHVLTALFSRSGAYSWLRYRCCCL